ncbi:hypothetical protein ACF0H5_022065 [Mactra antiquata]
MSLRFQDKVAIVTGGCSGIGKGCAEVLVEQGGIVVVLDKAADETSPSLTGPGKVKYMKCDVTNEEQVKNCVEQTVKDFGKIDCLVNNAGVHTGLVTIDTISVEDFKTLFDINVVSMFIMSKYALPHLRKTKGSIVNLSSFSAVAGQASCPTYCATKGAITSFAKGLAADEAKNGVRVNTICPGPTNTPLLQGIPGGDNPDNKYEMVSNNKIRSSRRLFQWRFHF